ncbi:MAG: hydroxylamine reductase, partial [Anaerotignum sp.]|nr:hydroxylamine reductase [Anaerotignum sp.]
MEQNMFCYPCQETAGCKGCTRIGVCGKTAQVAAMQDLLVYVSKGLSAVTTQLRKEGKTIDSTVNHMVTLNLFVTITNANFDEDMIVARILDTLNCKEKLLSQV